MLWNFIWLAGRSIRASDAQKVPESQGCRARRHHWVDDVAFWPLESAHKQATERHMRNLPRGQWKHQRLSSNRPIIFLCACCDPPTRVITGRVYLSICGELELLTAAAGRWRWTRPGFNLSVELRADRVSDGKQSGDHFGFPLLVGWNGRTPRNSLINRSENHAFKWGKFLHLLIV